MSNVHLVDFVHKTVNLSSKLLVVEIDFLSLIYKQLSLFDLFLHAKHGLLVVFLHPEDGLLVSYELGFPRVINLIDYNLGLLNLVLNLDLKSCFLILDLLFVLRHQLLALLVEIFDSLFLLAHIVSLLSFSPSLILCVLE